MTEKLLPCPFCGGLAVRWDGEPRIVCNSSGCGGETESEAAWNRRTPAPEGVVQTDPPVVSVGREEIARIIEPEFFSIGRAGPGYEPHRASAFRKADAILAALGTKPADTGREG